MRLAVVLAALVVSAAILILALSAGNDDSVDDPGRKADVSQAPATKNPPEPVLPESTCPPDLSNCVVASGRVIYVESVDPDGDGDAHFVTESEDGVTVPGLTIFDVKPELRPEPLPEVGDLVGGAGPVFRGSYGQKQIEVVEFHVAR